MASNNCKKKILHVVGTLKIGGAEMMLLQYTKALGGERFEHYVYCFGSDGPVRNLLESLGVSVVFGSGLKSIINPVKFFFSLYALFKNIILYIRENNIQAIVSHSDQSDKVAVVAGKITAVPAFPTIHSTQSVLDKRNKLDLRVYINKAVDHIVYRIADMIIAVSPEVKEIVCKRYNLSASRVIVVKNGIVFHGKFRGGVFERNNFDFRKNRLKILAVGRLAYEKNFDVLIRAIAHIVEKGFTRISVQVLGDGEEYEKLSSLINSLQLNNYVELLGYKDNVIEYMLNSHVFVITSRYEGLSVAMIEAFSCSLPVVASNAPGLRDFINNENGILFAVGDYVDLAENIVKLFNDEKLYRLLSDGAKKSFFTNYDMTKNIKPLIDAVSDTF